jgi:hypothetical protein
MITDVQMILDKVSDLSVEDLLKVQQTVTFELQKKAPEKPSGRVHLPRAYRRTKEEVEAMLKALFTPEEYAEIGKRDFSKMKIEGKTFSEMVNEDREDRF